MRHDFNSRVQGFGMRNHSREVLQDQAARGVRPFALELGQVMANTPAHVNNESILVGEVSVGQELLVHWVETSVHPAGPSQAVDGHVVVELFCGEGVLFGDLEEMEICIKAELEGSVCGIGRVVIVVLLEMGWKGVDAGCESARPGVRQLC